jgi:hypothetical protein
MSLAAAQEARLVRVIIHIRNCLGGMPLCVRHRRGTRLAGQGERNCRDVGSLRGTHSACPPLLLAAAAELLLYDLYHLQTAILKEGREAVFYEQRCVVLAVTGGTTSTTARPPIRANTASTQQARRPCNQFATCLPTSLLVLLLTALLYASFVQLTIGESGLICKPLLPYEAPTCRCATVNPKYATARMREASGRAPRLPTPAPCLLLLNRPAASSICQ